MASHKICLAVLSLLLACSTVSGIFINRTPMEPKSAAQTGTPNSSTQPSSTSTSQSSASTLLNSGQSRSNQLPSSVYRVTSLRGSNRQYPGYQTVNQQSSSQQFPSNAPFTSVSRNGPFLANNQNSLRTNAANTGNGQTQSTVLSNQPHLHPEFYLDFVRNSNSYSINHLPNIQGISYYETHNFATKFNLDGFEQKYLLRAINDLRSEVQANYMNVLRWNESLAGQAWMDVKDCVYKNRRNGAVQAMIHEKKTGNSMFSEAVSRWSDEKNFFDPYMPCNVRNSCRYSQLVWATSREVGCARKKCNDMSFITCMYYPVGNTAGYTAYVEGTRCEGCKNSCNSDKLCEWPPNSQPQQGSAFGTPPMGQNRFGNQPMMQQPFF